MIKRINFATNVKISSLLFVFLARMTLKLSVNCHEIESCLNKGKIFDYNEISGKIKENNLHINTIVLYKWIKKFLHLLISESNYLMGNSEVCQDFLQVHFFF